MNSFDNCEKNTYFVVELCRALHEWLFLQCSVV